MPSIAKLHAVAVSISGVGPAVRTGKPRSRYWPGGIRSATLVGDPAAAAAEPARDEPSVHAQPPSGEGGIRVSPVTSAIRMTSSSGKHQDHSSPGSSERISACPLAEA